MQGSMVYIDEGGLNMWVGYGGSFSTVYKQECVLTRSVY